MSFTLIIVLVFVLLIIEAVILWYYFKHQLNLNLPPKDPSDFTTTLSSTCWIVEQTCLQCKHWIPYDEQMSGVCKSCGCLGYMREIRSYRKIWDGKKWLRQFRYGNGPTDFTILNHGNRPKDFMLMEK
jgi:hypothetical protein